MEATEFVKEWQQFLTCCYKTRVIDFLFSGAPVVISFKDLSEFSLDVADDLLDRPEEHIGYVRHILELDFDCSKSKYPVHFNKLPKDSKVTLADIRSKHINKLISTIGVVRQRSAVRPNISAVSYECPSCGNVINVIQTTNKMVEPTKCGCGRKGKFKILSKELIDIQGLMLEETVEFAEGDKTERMNIILKNELTLPSMRPITRPGGKVVVNGIIKEVFITTKEGAKSTTMDLVLEANYVEGVDDTYDKIKISDVDRKEILRISKEENVFDLFTQAIAPNIYGYEHIKKALVVQCFGGVRKARSGDADTRGNIHIFLVGDPGMAKSYMLERISKFVPKGRFVSAVSATGVGLTGSVVKDEFLKGYTLEAGAMVLANHGLCCIDELDKSRDEDRNLLHEAMEQERVTISKANIQEQLPTQTTVLAAANPKTGRFNSDKTVASQIALPSTLINRFDFIFILKDKPEEGRDAELADHVLNGSGSKGKVSGNPFFDVPFAQKYVAYAKTHCNPVLSDEAKVVIKDFYIKLRKSAGGPEDHPIPISPRQLRAIVRVTEALARIRLSDRATKFDAEQAVAIMEASLKDVAMDPVTGQLDIDRIAGDTPFSVRKAASVVRDLCHELTESSQLFSEQELVEACKIKGIPRITVEDVLDKLKREAEVYEPKPGMFRIVR